MMNFDLDDEFRCGNMSIYVVFDEECEFSGPLIPKLSLDQVYEERVPYTNLCFNMLFSSLLVFFSNMFRG